MVIGGIRFAGLDPNFPFVEINASFDIIGSGALDRVAREALTSFGAFSPKGKLMFGPPDMASASGKQQWAHTLAGVIEPSRAGTSRCRIQVVAAPPKPATRP